MKTSKSLSAALMIALTSLAACAADAPGGGGPDDPDGPGGPDDVANLKLSGKFQLTSKFDIATNMPGTAGDVLNEIIAATDGGDDPARYLVDKVLAQLPNGALKDALGGAVPFVSDYLNDRLISLAPEFVPQVIKIGNSLGEATKNFGTISELNVTGAANALSAVHTVSGVQFKIEGTELPFMFADYNTANVVTNGVGIVLDQGGKVTIASHKVPLSFGKVMRIALDEAVIPLVDPSARNLNEVFANLVNCQRVGQSIADALGVNAPTAFENACKTGLNLAAGAIYSKIEAIDASALEFQMTGTARAIDKTRDNNVDELQRGAWGGNLSYAGSPAPLANASFAGEIERR
jgi:hypothetical protein